MRKWNKKGSLGIVFITMLLLIGWIFMWVAVDFSTATADYIINKTVKHYDTSLGNWSEQYSVFQSSRTNMNRILFWAGLLIITFAGIGAAVNQRVETLRRL